MISFHLDLAIPDPDIDAWMSSGLLLQEGFLRSIEGHQAIDLGENLLGCVVSIRGQTTLEGALRGLGGLADPERVARWEHVVEDGADCVRIEQSGELPRDATVAQLLSHLETLSAEGTQFFRRDRAKGRTRLWGVFPDWDAYSVSVWPLTCCAAAALSAGGRGMLSFLGSSDDNEMVATLMDFGDGQLRIDLPDPQNLDAADWRRRLGRTPRSDRVFEKWLAVHGDPDD